MLILLHRGWSLCTDGVTSSLHDYNETLSNTPIICYSFV